MTSAISVFSIKFTKDDKDVWRRLKVFKGFDDCMHHNTSPPPRLYCTVDQEKLHSSENVLKFLFIIT